MTILSPQDRKLVDMIVNRDGYNITRSQVWQSNFAKEFDKAAIEYRYQDNKSDKFWVIHVMCEGLRKWHVVTEWGRMGNKGQTNLKHFVTKNGAIGHARKQCNLKLRKGYTVYTKFTGNGSISINKVAASHSRYQTLLY